MHTWEILFRKNRIYPITMSESYSQLLDDHNNDLDRLLLTEYIFSDAGVSKASGIDTSTHCERSRRY